ncbi:MAG: hypothetical protein ACI4JB_10220, partial [Porcipelethomonas sp.]
MNLILFDPGAVLLFYIAGCSAVLIFNILYVIADRFSGGSSLSVKPHIKSRIVRQMDFIVSGKDVGKFRIFILRKKLSSVFYLRIFIQVIKEAEKEWDNTEAEKYRSFLHNIFQDLLQTYKRKGEIERSFFAYAAEKTGILS